MRTTSLFAAVLVVACAVPAAAQSNWGGHTNAGEWAFARGDVDRAEEEFRTALDIAQGFPEGDIRLEESLRNLARVYEYSSDWDQAEPLYLLLQAAEEHRLGEDSPKLLTTLAALARVAVPAGDHPVAISSLERYVTICDKAGITDDDRLRIVLSTLTHIYLIQDEGAKALASQRRSAQMALANPGLDGTEAAAALESQAQLEIQFGDATAAPGLIEKAVALRRKANPQAPVDASYLDAARTAVGAGETDVASALLDAFRRAEPDAGPTLDSAGLEADVAWAKVRRDSASLIDLQAATADPADLAAADEKLTVLDTLQRSELGATDVSRLETLGRRTKVAVMRGDLAAATTLQQELVGALETLSGAAAQPTRTARRAEIDLLLAQRRNAEAADANASLIAALDAAWGSDDPRLLPSLRLQYDLLKDAHRKKEAKEIRKRIKKLE